MKKIILIIGGVAILLMAFKCTKKEDENCHQHFVVKNTDSIPVKIYRQGRSASDYSWCIVFVDLLNSGEEKTIDIGSVCIEDIPTSMEQVPNPYIYYLCDTVVPVRHWYNSLQELNSAYNVLKIINLRDSSMESLNMANFTFNCP